MSKEFYIWEGIFKDFKCAKNYSDGSGFSGKTYNKKAIDSAKECIDSLAINKPIPFFHKQRSVLLPPVVGMMLNKEPKINVLDFGEGLGIGYMILKESIPNAKSKIDYTIIELPEICEQGKDLHKNEIHFIDSFSGLNEFQLIHSSSAIQYVNDWKSLVNKFCSLNPSHILMSDVFAGDFKTFVTLQNYYSNKIPHWFFNTSEFVEIFDSNGYYLEMKSDVSAKRLNFYDELPMKNFDKKNRLKYTSHMLFSKK